MSLLLKILGVIMGIIVVLAGFLGITNVGDQGEDLLTEIEGFLPSDRPLVSYPDAEPQENTDLPENIWEALGEEYTDFADALRSGKEVPAVVTYYQDWEFRMACDTRDPRLIEDLFTTLDCLSLTGTTDMMVDDYSNIIVFEMEDGTTYAIEFNNGSNLVAGDTIYTADDLSAVDMVLDAIVNESMILDDGDDNFIIDDNGDLVFIGGDIDVPEDSGPFSDAWVDSVDVNAYGSFAADIANSVTGNQSNDSAEDTGAGEDTIFLPEEAPTQGGFRINR